MLVENNGHTAGQAVTLDQRLTTNQQDTRDKMTEQNSGILGIKNRTENWKTARSFAPFFRVNRHILADRLCGKAIHGAGDVHLELFWKGMRDYVHHHKPDRETLAEELGNLYNSLFPDLRGQIESFGRFQLNPDNYRVISVEQRRKMATNIRNTEVDIILETPSHLFVGEA